MSDSSIARENFILVSVVYGNGIACGGGWEEQRSPKVEMGVICCSKLNLEC